MNESSLSSKGNSHEYFMRNTKSYSVIFQTFPKDFDRSFEEIMIGAAKTLPFRVRKSKQSENIEILSIIIRLQIWQQWNFGIKVINQM